MNFLRLPDYVKKKLPSYRCALVSEFADLEIEQFLASNDIQLHPFNSSGHYDFILLKHDALATSPWKSFSNTFEYLKPGGEFTIICNKAVENYESLLKLLNLTINHSQEEPGYFTLSGTKDLPQPNYSTEKAFNELEKFNEPVAKYFKPDRLNFGAWTGHIQFANTLIKEHKPKTIVELGTHYGDSYFTFCQSVLENNLQSCCYAVDTWEGDHQAGLYGEEVFNSVNPHNEAHYKDFSYLLRMTFLEASQQFSDNSIDLLHIDGLHTYEAVKEDWDTWFPKVKPGGIILFHDVAARHGDFGVWKLWEEITPEFDHFLFRHSWGLGVLRKNGGEPLPEGVLKPLFNGNHSEKASIENHFLLRTKLMECERRIKSSQNLHDQTSLFSPVLEALIKEKWSNLKLIGISEVYIYGAGQHTKWLLKVLDKRPGPKIKAILDDNPDKAGESIFGVKIVNTGTAEIVQCNNILLSSDVHQKYMQNNLQNTLPGKLNLIDLYEQLPKGPYPK